MNSPEEAAMLGFSPASGARVAACEVVGDFAAVYVVTNDPTGTADTLSILRRRGSSWHELAGGGAGATWIGFPDDDTEVDDHREAGVLAYPGEDPLRKVLEDGLLRATALIAVLTEEAAQRPWVIWETASAWAREQLVIPVFVDVRPEDVPGPLATKVQGVHLADRSEIDRALRIVASRLAVTEVEPITDDQFADLVNAAQ